MRSRAEVEVVGRLIAEGATDGEIARQTNIASSTVKKWRLSGRALRLGEQCGSCGHDRHDFAALPGAPYAYLLGLYLGDGYIVVHRGGVFRLSVYLDQRYPAIIDDCAEAMERVILRPAGRARRPGCVAVNSYSKQWPCLFPQHAAGPKHLRTIALTDWQQAIVDEHPEPLLRGLIHSDGCRFINRVIVGGKEYNYPRYNFSNASDDIRRIFTDTCDAIDVEWRRMNARNISVARRASVARLDAFIGPKS